MRPLLTSFLIMTGFDSSKSRSINRTVSLGTTGGWTPGSSRPIELVSDCKKPATRGEFEELDDEADNWSAQRIDEDEGKSDEVPLHVIKVVTKIEQLVKDRK